MDVNLGWIESGKEKLQAVQKARQQGRSDPT
jgi:hypothetical protein